MSKRSVLFLLLALLTGVLVGYLGFSSSSEVQQGLDTRPVVAASIFPVYDMAREIAGDQVRVELVLPPGASPHSYEPTPSDLRRLQNADAVYVIGHGLDDWARDLVPGAPIFAMDQGVELHSEGGGTDPHYWLSLNNALAMVQRIRGDLRTRYPEHADTFDANAEAYAQRLRDTRSEMVAMHADLPSRKLVTLHDAWYYFAQNTGLEIVGAFEEAPGLEPTPQYLAELSRAVEESGAHAIYAEPQLSISGLEAFARDNGLTIAVLDPLGGVPGRESYIDLLLYNARQIAENQ